MKTVTKIPESPSFVYEKFKKWENENGTGQKRYGNGKNCSEMEAETIQHLYSQIAIPIVSSRKLPSKFRIHTTFRNQDELHNRFEPGTLASLPMADASTHPWIGRVGA